MGVLPSSQVARPIAITFSWHIQPQNMYMYHLYTADFHMFSECEMPFMRGENTNLPFFTQHGSAFHAFLIHEMVLVQLTHLWRLNVL